MHSIFNDIVLRHVIMFFVSPALRVLGSYPGSAQNDKPVFMYRTSIEFGCRTCSPSNSIYSSKKEILITALLYFIMSPCLNTCSTDTNSNVESVPQALISATFTPMSSFSSLTIFVRFQDALGGNFASKQASNSSIVRPTVSTPKKASYEVNRYPDEVVLPANITQGNTRCIGKQYSRKITL